MDTVQDQASTKLAVFDIDGTFYRSSLNIEVIDQLVQAGLIPEERLGRLYEARAEWKNRKGTYTEYIRLLVDLMHDGLLAGIPEDRYQAVTDSVVAALANHVYLFTSVLHESLRGEGYTTVALSGSPDHAVKRFAERWGFAHYVATQFQVDEAGCLISTRGTIDVPADRKGEEFKRLRQHYGAHPYLTVAVGDTAGDAPMLKEAEYPIAFNPDKELEGIAWEFSWPIAIERKNTVTLFRRETRCKPETILPRPVALALREHLAARGITIRP